MCLLYQCLLIYIEKNIYIPEKNVIIYVPFSDKVAKLAFIQVKVPGDIKTAGNLFSFWIFGCLLTSHRRDAATCYIYLKIRQRYKSHFHCVKSVQIWSYFWSVFSCIRTKYGEILPPYFDTFHVVFDIGMLAVMNSGVSKACFIDVF